MPSYTFINLDSKEELNELMTISEMEAWLVEHPGWDVKPAAPYIGDITRQGLKKPSNGFRDILRHYKRKYKGSKRLGSDHTRGINTF